MKNTLLLCTAALLLAAAGCKKDLNESVQSAEDHAQLETEFAQIFDAVSDLVATEGKTGKTGDYVLPSAVTIEYTDTTFDDFDGVDLTIDYGPLEHGGNYKGVLCKDGRYRAGKLRVGINKRYNEIPHILTIATSTSELYYVGNGSKMHQITGTEVITRTTDVVYTVEINDATLKRDNGTATWSAERTVTVKQDAGFGWWGDEYEVTGSASGNNANGESFTATINQALVKQIEFSCLGTYVSGKQTITSAGKNFDVEYDVDGAQTCDRIVKVTVDGKDKEVTLF